MERLSRLLEEIARLPASPVEVDDVAIWIFVFRVGEETVQRRIIEPRPAFTTRRATKKFHKPRPDIEGVETYVALWELLHRPFA
ncbi:MAG: hypothetical protein QM755_16330 [Luteolibacter sp.]